MKRLERTPATETYLKRMLVSYEAKKLQPHEQYQFFQDLIDTGMIWELGDKYSRVAIHLIEQGKLNPPPSGFIPELEPLSPVSKRNVTH